MREAVELIKSEGLIAMLIASPSPLVGEGITAGKPELGWVRGNLSTAPMPLTRLRFAKPPSPTGGEGKRPAIQQRPTK
jgi:hypothetical protein